MATKGRTKGTKAGGRGRSVSLAEEDRRYIKESLSSARGRVGGVDLDERGVLEALERFGLSSERVERLRAAIADLDVRDSIDKASDFLAEQIENAREYTRENPKKVVGSAAGVLVGASLLALAIRRAAGEERKRPSRPAASTTTTTSSKKKGSSKKSSGSKKSKKR